MAYKSESTTAKLTEALMKSLELPEGVTQAYVWDEKVKGFGVQVGATTRTFLVRERIERNGKVVRTKVKIGHHGAPRPDGGVWTVETARAEAQRKLGAMKGGADPNAAKIAAREGVTLRQALEFHVEKMRNGENRRQKPCSERSIRSIKSETEHHFAAYLDRPLIAITADVLDDVRRKVEKTTERLAGANPDNPPGRALGNRLIAHIRAIWRSWHKRHGLPIANPAERIESRALKARDTRVMNDDLPGWYAKVQSMENRVRADLQLLSMFVGVRTDGIRHLAWDDVDYEQELIFVRRAKGDKPYVVPMTKTVREILERRENENAALAADPKCAPWVFPSPDSDEGCVAEVKERRSVYDEDGDVIRRESYLPGVHVNRRTYLSVASEVGISQADREALANHEGRGVNAKHYTRPDNWDHLRTIADRIEAGLWARIRGEIKSKGKRRGRALAAVA